MPADVSRAASLNELNGNTDPPLAAAQRDALGRFHATRPDGLAVEDRMAALAVHGRDLGAITIHAARDFLGCRD
jgi:hypothetical protein